MDSINTAVVVADEAFVASLLAADHDTLSELLTEDFAIVDVVSGRVTGREEFLGAISSRMLRFTQIVQFSEDRSTRHRDEMGVVVGRTRMVMRMGPGEMIAQSRYTHVYVRDAVRWRLMSAQGTSLAEQGPLPTRL